MEGNMRSNFYFVFILLTVQSGEMDLAENRLSQ
jgi:hypothetical protein